MSAAARRRRAALAIVGALASGCPQREPTPLYPQTGPAGGYAPRDFDTRTACGRWRYATSDPDALRHVAFAEQSPEACFSGVRYDGERVVGWDAPSPGCGFPQPDSAAALEARARVYAAVAAAPESTAAAPLELACALPADVRRAAADANARTLRAYAASLRADGGTSARAPYAVVAIPGYGDGEQDGSVLVDWRPGAACRTLPRAERERLGVNNVRASRAAEAQRSGVAPIVVVSGGAVHSRLVEAFALGHLAICDGGVPADRVLYDPCADHTHTNLRNIGALIAGIGARTGYLVTDSFIQGDYLQDYGGFEWVGGALDERALRDWGYLIGAWRQASSGIEAGFWFTPYRFFADPRPALASFHCVGDAPIAR